MLGPFAISVAVHGAILAIMVLGLPASAPEGAAEAAGLGGLEVSLGPAGGAPGGEAAPVTPEIPEAETVEAVETAEIVPEQVVEAVPEQTVEAIPEQAVEVAELPPEVVAEPVPTQQAVEAEPVEVIEEAPDIVEVATQAVIQPPPPPRMKPPAPVQEMTREVPQDPVPQQPAEAKPAPVVPPEQIAAIPPGSGGKSGTEEQPDTGSGNASTGGGLAGKASDYTAVLQAWLERYKEYPRRAQLRRQEGTVLLRFVMDREGHVLSYRVERSSGHRALDREVEEMIERAQPLPAMPEEMQQAQLELVVPIQFFLR